MRAALEGLELVHGLLGLGSAAARGRAAGRGWINASNRAGGSRATAWCASWVEAGWARSTRPCTSAWTGRWRSRCWAIHAAPDSSARRRFLNEARTAAGLHHTHIVPVFDVGQVGGLCYYAMQRIEGSGLDRVVRHLRRSRPLRSRRRRTGQLARSADDWCPGARGVVDPFAARPALGPRLVGMAQRGQPPARATVPGGNGASPARSIRVVAPVAIRRRTMRSPGDWAIRRPRGVTAAGTDSSRCRAPARHGLAASGIASALWRRWPRPSRRTGRRDDEPPPFDPAARIGLFSLGRRGRFPVGRCAGARPPPRGDPPRRQALQPADRRQGQHLGHGLRAGSPAGRPGPDPPRQPARHAAVHESRAGPHRLDRRADRRLQPGSDALRALDASGRRSTAGLRPS